MWRGNEKKIVHRLVALRESRHRWKHKRKQNARKTGGSHKHTYTKRPIIYDSTWDTKTFERWNINTFHTDNSFLFHFLLFLSRSHKRMDVFYVWISPPIQRSCVKWTESGTKYGNLLKRTACLIDESLKCQQQHLFFSSLSHHTQSAHFRCVWLESVQHESSDSQQMNTYTDTHCDAKNTANWTINAS